MKNLKLNDKVVYGAPYIKPSIATVENLNGEIALLDNKIRIYAYPNSEGTFSRVDHKEGYALPYSEENIKVVEIANFCHQLDFTKINDKIRELYRELPNPQAMEKLELVKRLINKINKTLE